MQIAELTKRAKKCSHMQVYFLFALHWVHLKNHYVYTIRQSRSIGDHHSFSKKYQKVYFKTPAWLGFTDNIISSSVKNILVRRWNGFCGT